MSVFYNKVCDSFYATIHMAGPADLAKHLIQKWALKGACVQVTECDYIYTGGRESGFTARFINYPRFPKENQKVLDDAIELGKLLVTELAQTSFSVETPDKTYMFSTREDKYETP